MITKKYVIGAAAKKAGGQTHIHEVQGLTEMADGHCHRFGGATGELIPLEKGGHRHQYVAVTDFVDGHYHKICVHTSPMVGVSEDEHVHYAEGYTSVNDGHKHDFDLTTFQAPNPGTN
ncbi:MAG: YmaF family protein [Bacillota bacterium]